MDPDDYFYQLLEIEPFYETEGIFFQPFWEFMYRYQSLQRHWQLSKGFIQNHISTLQRAKGDGSAEFEIAFSETAQIDIEFFPDYLRLSTLSFSLSLVENLLGSLSDEIAQDLGVKVKLVKERLPSITKYILWLTRDCGIDINIDSETWKNMDTIRAIRNTFIHRIDRDIPNEVRKAISEMHPSVVENKKMITDEFVDVALMEIAGFVKSVELGYIEFYRKRNG
jgi:hypothetical protein